MKSRIAMMLLLLVITGIFCSVKPPEVSVTGGKTALEQEVLGTYQRIEEDTWMVASSRSQESGQKAKLSPEKKRVLDAMQNQKFNKDDVDEFKRKGYVGETRDGLLVIRDTASADAEAQALIREIVDEENESRKVVIERVVELNDALQKETQEDVMRVFANIYQENSPEGTWIQAEDGEWAMK
jgi:uncharacterized protein YdbL (DUF1318 family)